MRLVQGATRGTLAGLALPNAKATTSGITPGWKEKVCRIRKGKKGIKAKKKKPPYGTSWLKQTLMQALQNYPCMPTREYFQMSPTYWEGSMMTDGWKKTWCVRKICNSEVSDGVINEWWSCQWVLGAANPRSLVMRRAASFIALQVEEECLRHETFASTKGPNNGQLWGPRTLGSAIYRTSTHREWTVQRTVQI